MKDSLASVQAKVRHLDSALKDHLLATEENRYNIQYEFDCLKAEIEDIRKAFITVVTMLTPSKTP